MKEGALQTDQKLSVPKLKRLNQPQQKKIKIGMKISLFYLRSHECEN